MYAFYGQTYIKYDKPETLSSMKHMRLNMYGIFYGQTDIKYDKPETLS